MSSTLVSWASHGKATKRTLYVGGLGDKVDRDLLEAAFIPFGDVKDVNIPIDFATGKHRGFGFVEYDNKEDAEAALDNMHNAEINGRVISVNFAQPPKKVYSPHCARHLDRFVRMCRLTHFTLVVVIFLLSL